MVKKKTPGASPAHPGQVLDSMRAAWAACTAMSEEPKALWEKHRRLGRHDLLLQATAEWLVTFGIDTRRIPEPVGLLSELAQRATDGIARVAMTYHEQGGFVTNKITTEAELCRAMLRAWRGRHREREAPEWEPKPTEPAEKEHVIVLTAMIVGQELNHVSTDTWKRLDDAMPDVARGSHMPITVPTDYLIIPLGRLEGLARAIGVRALEAAMNPAAAEHRLVHGSKS